MKTLFTGLAVQTVGLVWDGFVHLRYPDVIEGLIEPAHLMIFAGFAVTFLGAILVAYQAWRRTGSTL